MASPHTALNTKGVLAARNLKCIPWLPSGADLSPLDIYVNPELKRRLKGKDLTAKEKLMAEVSRARADMRSDEKFLGSLRKCCRSIKKRAKWAHSHNGRISNSDLFNKWSGEDAGEAAATVMGKGV